MAKLENLLAPTTTNSAGSKYRPEIDGLRAFAVIAVIINHFNSDILPSGYLGVDIFFVISGFVITSSLAGRDSKNFLDFLTSFYERRIKRLVPALVVFVLITSILSSLFIPDPDLAFTTGAASLIGFSNIYLLNQSTDYFAQSTELNPFTHTWSLGVEEQFYLLFPFLIWFTGFGQHTAKGARNLFLSVGALTVSSLIGFVYLYQVNQPAAYFLMPTRFWEMAAGCLVFIGFQQRAIIEQSLEKVPPLLVVGAMLVVMFFPVSHAVPATISIVILTTILIACLKNGSAAYKFFTIKQVVYIGLISYSLYLWHWVVLCISRWTIGIHWWSIPFQVFLILLLSILSFNFIEKRLRGIRVRNRLLVFASFATIVPASSAFIKIVKENSALFFVGSKSVGKRENQLRESALRDLKISSSKVPLSRHLLKCWSNNTPQLNNSLARAGGFTASFLQDCLWRGASDRFLMFVGDSHNHAWINVALGYHEKKYTVFFHSKSGCLFPAPNPYSSTMPQLCDVLGKSTELELESLAKTHRTGAVVINFYAQGHFNSEGHMSPPEISTGEYINRYINQISRVASAIRSMGNYYIIIVAPKPDHEYYSGSHDKSYLKCGYSLPLLPGYLRGYNQGCNGDKYSTSRRHIEQENQPIMKSMRILASTHPNIVILDTFPVLCAGQARCSIYDGANTYYDDDNHLSGYGSWKVDKLLLEPVLQRLLD